MRRSFAIFALLSFAVPALALEPAEVAVLFNTQSPGSLAVARHYLNARNIPPTHLIAITCEVGEGISEELYRTSIVPQVSRALREKRLLPDAAGGVEGIKCLVTSFDLPLRISARTLTPAERQEIAAFQKQQTDALAELERLLESLARIAPAPEGDVPATAMPTTAPATAPTRPMWQQMAQRFNAAAVAAGGRIDALPPEPRAQAAARFIELQEKVGGIAGLLNVLRIPADATGPEADAGRQRLAELSAQARQLQQWYATAAARQDSPEGRGQMVALRRDLEGLLGQARCLEELLTYLQPANTSACFDSELALVLADQSYPRAAWISNPMSIETYSLVRQLPVAAVPPTLMVTRLDGLTVQQVQEMIDLSLRVETEGLDGRCYLDARGLRGTDAYGVFDADLRRAADWLKEHSTMATLLDDTPGLFVAADAPQCAVYAGWYSLKSYRDSAQWLPGAVGYHIASLEMVTLRNAKETGWVPNLLSRGFAGTLGATEEPYLNSFPKPSLFIPLLLSGEFTQGEVWQLTAPCLSWRVGFVGDPLYNPFRARPRVKPQALRDHIILRDAYDILKRTPSENAPAPLERSP